MKKLMLGLCAGLLLFTTTAEAKPNNKNKQHQKAWIQQHKTYKHQEKMQKEQYKAVRKQQKEYDKLQRKANRPDDNNYGYGYENRRDVPQSNSKWGLGDILGGIGL